MARSGPAIYLEADSGPYVTPILAYAGGAEKRLPRVTPAEHLLAALEIDYGAYRREIKRLRDEHPLFEERIDIPEGDYEDFISRALPLAEMLRETDPIAYFVAVARLDAALRVADEGSAAFLLYSGMRMIRILEEPIRAQVRLRNILEVAFDGMERASQRERREKLRTSYPRIVGRHFLMRWMEDADGSAVFDRERAEYMVGSLFELRLLELELYFRQEKQRIARCEYCWEYFIPKTTKATLYCDREWNGKSCKQLGPNLKRREAPERDATLQIFERLRRRLRARAERYDDLPPEKQQKQTRFGLLDYRDWSADASEARMAYLAKEITTEEFLRRVDIFGYLDSYEAGTSAEEVLSRWQQEVQHDIDFDFEARDFPGMVLDLRDPAEEPRWQYPTREDWRKFLQQGHESLRDKYD